MICLRCGDDPDTKDESVMLECWIACRKSCFALALILLVGCVVDSVYSEGRTCTGDSRCGPGTWCDPVSNLCRATPRDAAPRDDASPERDAETLDHPVDEGVDLAHDLASDHVEDVEPDSGPPKALVCSAATLAVTKAHDSTVIEIALRTNGLTLVATSNEVWLEANRPSVGQPFEKWETASSIPASFQDPTFFTHQSKEWAISAFGDATLGPRQLRLCDGLSCSDISILDENSAPILVDIDGPSVADGAAQLLLTINVKKAGLPGEGFLATPTDDSLLTWKATRLTELDSAGVDVDDPAISPDGTVIVFSYLGGELWSVTRDALDQPFSAPHWLAKASDVAGLDLEPELASLPSGKLELFFRSDRAAPDTYRVYRSVCWR